LAALLTGGSSKEFESEVTTGRFGTGFLVTHVLAQRATLRGLLTVSRGWELFELALDRSGDEDAILANSRSCNEALRHATPVKDFAGIPSARFEYPIADDRAVQMGLETLKQALPYLYGTRRSLSKVEFTSLDGSKEIWSPAEVVEEAVEGGYVQHRTIDVVRGGDEYLPIRVYRFMTAENSAAAALVLVGQSGDGWEVLLPEDDAPKIYREYPLRGSGFVPTNFVFDGKFDPDQERVRLLMSDEDKELLEDAFAAGVVAAKYAFAEKWGDAHLLARASTPKATFDPTNVEEKKWWTKQLASFAERLAALPIVECTSESLPAIRLDGWFAHFVVPRLLPESTTDETTVDRLWPLVAACTQLMPPKKELAVQWTEIAEGWHSLGLDVSRITLGSLAEWVREEAKELEELHLEGDKTEWLARFMDVVGECWGKRTGVELSVFAELTPDQNGRLCSPQALHRDVGVSAALKDICKVIGHDVRGKLLLSEIEEMAKKENLQYLPMALKQAFPTSLSEAQVIDEAVNHLDESLPEDEECGDSVGLQHGAVLLLEYLWKSQGKSGAPTAKKVPLITSNELSVRWSHDRMMMAPVCSWHEAAQPFAVAYPPQRLLANFFAGDTDEGVPDIVPALVEFGMAIADPITSDTPAELRGSRLNAISPADTEGIVVSNQRFSQIALLQPDVLNRCQEGVDEARALLGLVLCHLAPHDPEWQQERLVTGRRQRQDVGLPVYGALWLADLKFRSWVPVPGDDGKPVKMRADAKTLAHLLDPSWLKNNGAAIRLLSEWFEFDELELQILGLEPDPNKRRELRSGIAKLVETGGADPEFYSSLADHIEDQRRNSRDIDRARRLGIAVQEAVKLALENYGLKLKLIDRGFDYEVTDDEIEDVATTVEVGPYLLEIKATTTGQARLTPTQAGTASEEVLSYVLCVVDLRDVPEEELDGEWTAERIEELAIISFDLGSSVKETCELVETARTNDVAIRNDAALRYEVPVSIWEDGVSITKWVEMIRQSQRQRL
jgi:hypothetical protein